MGKTLHVTNHVLKNGYEYETSPFGPRKDPISGKDSYHNGEDIISKKYGTDHIIAFQDGTVEAMRNTITGMDKVNSNGNYIYIKHQGGYQTRYLHLKKDTLTTKVGQAVKKGEVIAYMGTTGYSTGNHLHFEVRLDGNPQDPIPYLTGEKAIPSLSSPEVAVPSAHYTINEIVTFKGGYHYSNARAEDSTGGIRTAGDAKITGYSEGQTHPYHLIGTKHGSNVYGWVDANKIEKLGSNGVPEQNPETEPSSGFKTGDIVKIKAGAKWYNGKFIPDWVLSDTWIVYSNQIGNRVVLNSNVSKKNTIMSPINEADLIRV